MANNHLRNLPVPFFSQRQNDYVYEGKYTKKQAIARGDITLEGKEYKVSMDNRTCNITSVMMVMKYLGLTGIERTVNDTTFTTPNTPKDFLTKYFNHDYDFAFGKDKPTYGVACLEDWNNLKKIGQHIFGADCSYSGADKSSITLQDLKDEISNGYPVCISIGMTKNSDGTYKKGGHVVVVRGFTKIGSIEYIILNDPWGAICDDEYNVYEKTDSTSLGSYFYGRTKDSRTNGDNVIVKLSDFRAKLVKGTSTGNETGTYFHNYMTIHSSLWNFPNGTSDFSTDEEQADIYTKIRNLNGGYPLCKNNVWHTGLHLAIDGGIHSIGPASLVAVRNSKVMNDSFDKSFILLEHKSKIGTEIKSFYSLYMHLKYIDIKEMIGNYFCKNENTPYSWLNQLLSKMLCYSLVVKNFNSDTDEEGLINASYNNIKLYKVNLLEDGTLVRETTASSKKLGRRCLITPLPIQNQKIYPKLLDPEKYNDDDFKSDLRKDSTYKYNDYVYFLLDDAIYSTKFSTANFEYGLIFYKQLLTTAKQIFNLCKGEIVTFSNGEDYLKDDVTQNLKNTLKEKEDSLATNLHDRFSNISNSTVLQLNANSPFLDLIDLCSIVSNMCCNPQELKKINDLYETYMNKFLGIYNTELNKYLNGFENSNENIKKHADENPIIQDSKTWKLYFQENCKLILEQISDQLNISIAVPSDFTDLNTSKNGSELAKSFINEIEKFDLSYSNKIIIYETLILWLEKIPANKIENYGYFAITDSCISACKNTILTITTKPDSGLLIKLKSIYNGTFTYFLENQIEIGKSEIIGNCGKYETLLLDTNGKEQFITEPQVHFEIFAENNILNYTKSQEDLDDDILYNPTKCIGDIKNYIDEELQKSNITAKYLDDNMLQISELKNIYTNSNNKFLEDLALHLKSPWGENKTNPKYKYYKKRYEELIDADNEEKLKKGKKLIEYDEYYENYIKPYMWFNSKIFDNKHFKSGDAWYYQPLKFIEDLVKL